MRAAGMRADGEGNRHRMLKDVLFVAAGGAIGSALRYSAMVWISQRLSQGFPWHTFLVNVVGSFLLGLLLSASVEHGGWDRWTLFLGIGVLVAPRDATWRWALAAGVPVALVMAWGGLRGAVAVALAMDASSSLLIATK